MLEYALVNRSFIFYVKNEKIYEVPIEDKGNWAFSCAAELFPGLSFRYHHAGKSFIEGGAQTANAKLEKIFADAGIWDID